MCSRVCVLENSSDKMSGNPLMKISSLNELFVTQMLFNIYWIGPDWIRLDRAITDSFFEFSVYRAFVVIYNTIDHQAEEP